MMLSSIPFCATGQQIYITVAAAGKKQATNNVGVADRTAIQLHYNTYINI
jgi:hypothetical protein